MTSHVDIAIVGGGMMGSTLALLLSRALPQKSVCLIDKAIVDSRPLQGRSSPSFDGRSTALAPTTVDLMKCLGVWSSMLSGATAINTVQVSDRGHCGWARLDQRDNAGRPLGYVVENQAIGQSLTTAVANSTQIRVCSGLAVNTLRMVKNACHLSLSDESQLSAELAVIADGANSALGHSIGIAQRVKDYQQNAIVANVQFERPHQGVAFERFTDQGPLALLPIAGSEGRTGALVWTWPKSQIGKAMTMNDEQFLAVLQKRFGHRLGHFVKVSQRVCYPLYLCVAEEQVRSNVLMMGNAAHFLHPVAGQGFNLAARDGLRLAQVLQRAKGSLGDLATLLEYQEAQSMDQFRTVTLSHGFNELFRSEHLPVVGLRNFGMLAIENCSLIRDVFIRQLSGRSNSRVTLQC